MEKLMSSFNLKKEKKKEPVNKFVKCYRNNKNRIKRKTSIILQIRYYTKKVQVIMIAYKHQK
jgi:hypothetical protein